MAFLLFDIGGTNMRIAVFKDGKSFDEPKIVPTPQDFDEGIQEFKEIALELVGNDKVDGVLGGIASPLDQNKEIINPPNLPGWQGKNFKKELENIFNVPVYLENDAALGGLGEAVAGAGKDYGIVAYVAIGTGVGGTRIVGGQIDKNAHGFEPGHQIINDGQTLEQFIGGGSIKKHYEKEPNEIEDIKVRSEIEKNLAYGLNNIAVLWSPDVMVLGGGQINNFSLGNIQIQFKNFLKIFPEVPLIKKAELGDKAGLYGALELIKQKHK